MIAIIGLCCVLAGGFAAGWFLTRPRGPAAGNGPAAPSIKVTDRSMTVDGWEFCLPRSATNRTTDCAIGIKTKDGLNYALVGQDLQPIDPRTAATGIRAKVTGLLVDDPDLQAKFNIAGTIQVQQQ